METKEMNDVCPLCLKPFGEEGLLDWGRPAGGGSINGPLDPMLDERGHIVERCLHYVFKGGEYSIGLIGLIEAHVNQLRRKVQTFQKGTSEGGETECSK